MSALKVATVSQINSYVKSIFERDDILNNIWIRGEISNFKLHYSGHMYMSLKDDTSVIRAVMFKNANMNLRFEPYSGMRVLVRGRVGVYERDGQYQVYIEEMIADGVGELYEAYEQLKRRLEKEGLFSSENKKPIPKYPDTIGVVTSATGAAVRDIINVVKRRNPKVKVCLYPVLVQGSGAAEEIASAIEYFNKSRTADVLIVGRGGGSIEDLWAFNEERVARAVFASEIPVISAVGHETDFTICDFVSDLRAPTPSAGAELATPSYIDTLAKLDDMENRQRQGLLGMIRLKKERIEGIFSRSVSAKFFDRISNSKMLIDRLEDNMASTLGKAIELKGERLKKFSAQLDALSPLKVLARGYAAVTNSEGRTITSVQDVKNGDNVDVRLCHGRIKCKVYDIES